eukprot:TRINITY_DN5893_c1_g1_i1.p1 TRINITY_DN5893_c1_g1~~TRINITY_DN5893_c1_g1_i1.p1  ORF type:complete len:573 (-),score=181.15 TRINITY_DN5893_c1_g1_i1:180-1898(-)
MNADDELIAKILLQDQLQDQAENPYFDDYEDGEDDFLPDAVLKAKAKSRGSNKKGNARKGLASDEDDTPRSKRRKSDTQAAESPFAAGKWTAQEEALFIEALDAYGRDWDKCVAHIGTRDKNNIKSHAQKHFIKLFKHGLPLPLKVQESGSGHTLSGKPLDPESAAARQYMGLPRLPSKKQQQQQHDGSCDHQPPQPATTHQRGKRQRAAPLREADLLPAPSPAGAASLEDSSSSGAPAGGRSEYARSRLRHMPQPSSLSLLDLDAANSHPLTMIKCQRYTAGPAGSEVAGAAPVRVTVGWQARALADLHAHLAHTEIIGLLAGSYRPDARELTVTDVFACRTLGTECDAVNVEMDPDSELEVRDDIRRRGLCVVGWYHSHPVFQPDPSIRDIENQANYQSLFRDEAHGLEPFIGMIIGPYDVRLPSEQSVINYFHVRPVPNSSGTQQQQPMAIEPQLLQPPAAADADADSDDPAAAAAELGELERRMLQLVADYARLPNRTRFDDVWRYAAPVQLEPGRDASTLHKEIVVKPLTRLEKLRHAMGFNMGHSGPAASVITTVCERIQSLWSST